MKHLQALVMMQLKDKLDFDFLSSKRTLISKIVFTLLKFIIVTAAAMGVFKISLMIGLFSLSSSSSSFSVGAS